MTPLREQAEAGIFRLRMRITGLLMAAGAVAVMASVLGFFGRWHWFLDLCSHFRVQYALGLVAVSLTLVIPRKRRAAALFSVVAAANLLLVLPLYTGRVACSQSGGRPIRAMLANVNTSSGSAAAVSAAIARFSPDILVLEEVNGQWLSNLRAVTRRYGHAELAPRNDNFGIALWSRFPLTRSRVVEIGDAGVPSLVVEVDAPLGRFTVLATHPLPPLGKAYSGFRNRQLAALPWWVRTASSPVVLLGDLNVTPWNHHFRRLLRESGLRDSAQGRGVQPTWPVFNPLLRIPLDHCLYGQGIGIVDRQVGPPTGSDHFPIIVEFVVR